MRPADCRRSAPKAPITMSTSSPVATVPVGFMSASLHVGLQDTSVFKDKPYRPVLGFANRGGLSTLEEQDRHGLLPRGIHQRVGAALAVCRDHNPHATDNGAALFIDDIDRVLIDP